MEALPHGPLQTPALYQPRSMHEAWQLKRELGVDAVYVSGSTLLRTQWEAGTASMPKALIDLRGLGGSKGIVADESNCFIGALTDLSACRTSIALEQAAPLLKEAARVIAAPSVRNLATIGGNVASGYGDALPALLVYEAELEVFEGKLTERLGVEEWLDTRWSGLQPQDQIITGIRIIPTFVPEGSRRFGAYRKIGRREAFTPSLVTVALAGFIDSEGILSGIRIAAGGGSSRPQRLGEAEALLAERCLSMELLTSAYEAVLRQFGISGDPFATAEYKKKTAANLIAGELWKVVQG